MPRRKKTPTAPESVSGEAVTSIKYPATRKNCASSRTISASAWT